MESNPFLLILAGATLACLALPAAAQQDSGFKTAITKQVVSSDAHTPAQVELTTMIPLPYELRFKGLSAPPDISLKSVQPDNSGCPDPHDPSKCVQRFPMAIEAMTEKNCAFGGDYAVHFDATCRAGIPGICTPGPYQVPFTLVSETSCQPPPTGPAK